MGRRRHRLAGTAAVRRGRPAELPVQLLPDQAGRSGMRPSAGGETRRLYRVRRDGREVTTTAVGSRRLSA